MKIKLVTESSGLYILFNSTEECHVDDIFEITYENEKRYFIVKEVSIDECVNLSIKAKEYGYYNKLYKKVDIRNLLNLDLKKIDDRETLNKLSQESRYC